MNVLSISNSFGDDANRYLHQIARAAGKKIEIATLYIGGCTLDTHYRNMVGDKAAYDLRFNGHVTGFKVSISEALLSREWDVVVLQQGSRKSYDADSYEPYISALADFVRECAPKAKLLIHQTWAYRENSDLLHKVTPYESARDMFRDIKSAYEKCVQVLEADGLIPSGQLLEDLLANGIADVHRDNLHVTYGLGRYALGLLWYRMLTGCSVADNTFCDFDEPVSQDEIALAKRLVDTFQPLV